MLLISLKPYSPDNTTRQKQEKINLKKKFSLGFYETNKIKQQKDKERLKTW